MASSRLEECREILSWMEKIVGKRNGYLVELKRKLASTLRFDEHPSYVASLYKEVIEVLSEEEGLIS